MVNSASKNGGARPVMVITGGARGIGAATALLAGKRGWDVCIGYLSAHDSASAVEAEVGRLGGRALACQFDVADEEDVKRLFQLASAELGPIAALVNNAATAGPGRRRIEQVSAADVNALLAVNVTGSIICAREAVLRMSTRRGGRGGTIVNVSSVAARLGAPGLWVDYAASKGALDSFTRGLAAEVAPDGIRVNAVRPGLIDTDIHARAGLPDRARRAAKHVPMQRAGRPEEVAEAILWLASEAASSVSGAILDVAGGS